MECRLDSQRKCFGALRMIPLKNHNICIFNGSSKLLSALSAWFPWSWDKSPPFWVNGETVTWREKATPS